jgi:hypothetical protein
MLEENHSGVHSMKSKDSWPACPAGPIMAVTKMPKGPLGAKFFNGSVSGLNNNFNSARILFPIRGPNRRNDPLALHREAAFIMPATNAIALPDVASLARRARA